MTVQLAAQQLGHLFPPWSGVARLTHSWTALLVQVTARVEFRASTANASVTGPIPGTSANRWLSAPVLCSLASLRSSAAMRAETAAIAAPRSPNVSCAAAGTAGSAATRSGRADVAGPFGGDHTELSRCCRGVSNCGCRFTSNVSGAWRPFFHKRRDGNWTG